VRRLDVDEGQIEVFDPDPSEENEDDLHGLTRTRSWSVTRSAD
jgi:hypothetical protein